MTCQVKVLGNLGCDGRDKQDYLIHSNQQTFTKPLARDSIRHSGYNSEWDRLSTFPHFGVIRRDFLELGRL